MKKYWDILGIEPTDNKRAIKKAYAKALQKYHPEDNPEEFKKVQEAYQRLIDSLDTNDSNITYEQAEANTISYNEDNKIENEVSDETIRTSSFVDNISIEDSKVEKKDIDDNYIKELYYQKMAEKLSFRTNFDTIHSIVNSKMFMELLEDSEYYQKIVDLFGSYLDVYDENTTNYLYKVFNSIEDRYKKPGICSLIDNKRNIVIKAQNKKKLMSILLMILAIIFIILRAIIRNM